MRKILLLCGALGLLGPPALALDFYVVPDAPIDLAGVVAGTALPWNVTRHNTPFLYTTGIAQPLPLPFNAEPDALHLMNNGDWLFSVEWPTDLLGVTYLPADVVRWSGGLYSPFFCGTAFGVPLGSNVDAVLLEGQRDDGELVISFDVPTTIGGTTYFPADLVRLKRIGPLCSSWVVAGLFFNSSTSIPPVPAGVNVTGADQRAGMPVLTFDVPVTLGPTFVPGSLVAYDATIPGFVPLHFDPAWTSGVRANAFSLLAAPGRIPCTPAPFKLEIAKAGAGQMTLFWSTSCSVGAENYGIYEGTLGTWYSHARIDCIDNGVPLQETIAWGANDHYYLVVPHNPNDEGSYGLDKPLVGLPSERPPGAPACQATQEFGCP